MSNNMTKQLKERDLFLKQKQANCRKSQGNSSDREGRTRRASSSFGFRKQTSFGNGVPS